MHGDCAPWNLRVTDAGLVLIDWEDAGWGPPGADEVFHRAAQAAVGLGEATASIFEEAIAYWTRRIAGRRDTKRDERLATGLIAALRQMSAGAPNRRGGQAHVSEHGHDDTSSHASQVGTETRRASGSVALPSVSTESLPATRPRVLVLAYACEPGRGSEPGAGWGLVQALSEFADGVVLTAPEHIPAIRRWQSTTGTTALEFHEVAEPRWAPLARKHRVTWFLLYIVWLRRARPVGQRLHAEAPFDLAYHATYSTYWMTSPVADFGIPAIWGSVGGAVTTPPGLWPYLGWRGIVDEILDLVGVRTMALLPGTRRTWRRVAVRLVQNDATLRALPRDLRPGTWLLNHALFTDVPPVDERDRGQELLLVSSLESRKGVALALRAVTFTPHDVRLAIVGDGPSRRSLERLARRLGIAHRVTFRGALPRDEVLALVRGAAAVVFTGLREEGGVALAEAMLSGAPVIVLANGGARTIAAAGTDGRRVALIEPGGREPAEQIGKAMTQFSRTPHSATDPLLDQRAARRALRAAFGRVWPALADRDTGTAQEGDVAPRAPTVNR
jgi:glycosyltransferase involved in cell wall biosynthesis